MNRYLNGLLYTELLKIPSSPKEAGTCPPFPSTPPSAMLPRSHAHLEELKLPNYLLRNLLAMQTHAVC